MGHRRADGACVSEHRGHQRRGQRLSAIAGRAAGRLQLARCQLLRWWPRCSDTHAPSARRWPNPAAGSRSP
ncbi:hypothetical protein XarbCFBP8150_21410, partial [Xanthomonas arboricola]